MKARRSWDEINVAPRPLCFCGMPALCVKPSSFTFIREELAAPDLRGQARIYYQNGWTALVFWNSDSYFADDTLTFDGMIELIRERFAGKFYLRAPILRAYVD